MKCRDFQNQTVLYFCDELDGGQIVLLEQHMRACADCATFFEKEQRLHRAINAAGAEEPSSAFLTECRVGLDAALDQTSPPGFWTRLGHALIPTTWIGSLGHWVSAHPAWSAAVFVVIGFSVANTAPSLLTAMLTDNPKEPTIEVRPAREEGASYAALPGPRAPIPDSPEMRWSLIPVVNDKEERFFSADDRLTSVGLLGAYNGHAEVRDALCRAVREDGNAGVRLRALEALRNVVADEKVRQVFLEALVNDNNPGVRIEAVNSLRSLAGASTWHPDQRYMEVLRERMEKDSNTYIRLESAAAMRQLAARGVY